MSVSAPPRRPGARERSRPLSLDDSPGPRISWRAVVAGVLAVLALLIAWFVTTNTYATVWQQRLTDHWAQSLGDPARVGTDPFPGDPVARISIPDLALERVVLEGVDRATLRKGPGHEPGTPLPGAGGNTVVRGHRLLWSGPFRDIGGLNFGAPIYVQLADGSVRTYLVAGIFRMDPDDPAVAEESQQDMLTLVTSDPPFRADRVLVVQAFLAGQEGG